MTQKITAAYAILSRGKSMLAQSEMMVVIVLSEHIS